MSETNQIKKPLENYRSIGGFFTISTIQSIQEISRGGCVAYELSLAQPFNSICHIIPKEFKDANDPQIGDLYISIIINSSLNVGFITTMEKLDLNGIMNDVKQFFLKELLKNEETHK